MGDRLNSTPEGEMRAWLWHCERALGHAHETRREAIACAKARIAREKERG